MPTTPTVTGAPGARDTGQPRQNDAPAAPRRSRRATRVGGPAVRSWCSRPRLRPAAGGAARASSPRTPRPTSTSTRPGSSARSSFMWNPTVGLGTVTHEYIGYLLPMGPFFAAFHLSRAGLGRPADSGWARSSSPPALGVLYLCRIIGLRGPGPAAAALAYMLSPYFLQYAGRISVILLPWAGLPVMLALTIVALRRGGWRWTRALRGRRGARRAGSTPAAIIYVGVAPVLWLLYAVVVLREATWRHALGDGAAHRHPDPGCLPVVDRGSARSRPPTASTSSSTPRPSRRPRPRPTPPDIFRGLGYWYFYGADQPRTLDQRSRPLHPEPRPAGHLVRRAGARAGGGGVRALARARPTSSCSSSWGWSSRSGPSPSPTPR